MLPETPSLSSLIARIELELLAKTGAQAALRRGTVEQAIARAMGMTSHGIHSRVTRIASELFTAKWARGWAEMLSIAANPARSSDGRVRFTGSESATIPAGTILLHEATQRRYLTTQEATIVGGEASVHVQAEQVGAQGDVEASISLLRSTSLAGIDQLVVVEEPGILDGTDRESDAELWERVQETLQSTGAPGSVSDYERWSKEVAGVTRVKCFPAYFGGGTALVVIANDAGLTPIPNETLVEEVELYLSSKIATGLITVAPTSLTTVDVEIELLKAISSERQLEAELQVRDLFHRRRAFGDVLTADEIKGAILAALHITEFSLIGPTTSVEAPTLGLLHLNEIIWS